MNLPPDYPMVAPNYAAWRSALVNQSGLDSLESRCPQGCRPVQSGQEVITHWSENVVPETRLTPALAISPSVSTWGIGNGNPEHTRDQTR
jgi:hypothetical protein